MSFTCLSWHTTGATFHYAKRVQKCAQNCRFWSFWPFLAILALFLPFLGRFGPFLKKRNVWNHVIYLSFMAHYRGNLSLCKKSAEMCSKWPFLVILAFFWPFLAVFCRFWLKKMLKIMSFTCLSWHTTGATFHYAKRVQKCALNGRFWSFLPFLAVFGRFWPFLKKKKCLKSCHIPVSHGPLQGQHFTL